ncbi:hypothetical protein LNM54_000840 [Salmonella enterica subsp. enterica]|nr:hypothetical protein [Salmonella enterica subsp. enterica]
MEIKQTAIDKAFQRFDTPVGPVYFVERHRRTKKCFSRDTAIRYLAFFMTTEAFGRSGFIQRHPDVKVVHPLNPELNCWQRGAATLEYYKAHKRCVRRLRRLLARKREIQKWKEKHKVIIDRFLKELNEHGTRCPY